MLLEKLNVKLGLGTETVKMVVKSKKKTIRGYNKYKHFNDVFIFTIKIWKLEILDNSLCMWFMK